MSWEEYKKKREETSSWEQYKQKRQANVSKNTVTTKSSTNNKTSLWDNIQNLASETGKVADNLWQSFKNGVMSYQQTVGRAANNTQAQQADLINRMHQKALEGRLKDNPEETEQINKIINNPLISGDKIRQESKEYYNKIQKKKNENTLKIQQNAESMNTEVGKYIAGEIAPGIGQMLPGMIGGPIGTTYFIGSATGNYYDDAKQRGMTEDQATIYSGVMGIIEGSLEAVGAKLTTNVGKQLLRKNIKGALVNYGLDIGENFLEESIVEPLSEIVATTAAGKDKADWSNIGQRMWQSGVAGAITSAIMGGASGAIGSLGSKVTQQNKYVDYNTNKKLDKNSQDILKQAENIIQKNNATNLQPQTMQNTQNMPSQQLMPSQQENAHNTNMKINKTLPMQNYIYEKSDNVKIDRFRQSASQNFDNSIKSRNYLNMLEKIITDKDVDIIFDSNLKDSQGRIANGSYSNGVITINPNSNRTGEFIAIHELTHAIGTNQMRNIVEQYRKSNKAFDSAVQQLLKNYNTTELTEEAMADVSAQLFGNQEFINNLAEREPSLFRKIYNEIKYLWHQFTGYKNQNQFIEDLQYKWEQAYRNNNKLNETTNYYIEPVAKFDEIEYNNVIEEKLNKREYAILRSIINSDSNIKPGINYVEVTNGRYTVYYKGFDDFKVMSRKVDADAGRINKRNDTTGGKTRYSKTFEQSIRDQGTTTSNDEVSNFNTSGTRERSGSNTSSSTNIENGINLSTKESENNSGSFNLQDNQGRTLTKEQQEYFKDSKVRDENGNLLTMYHGTPNGYYTIFKDGTYFSPRKEYADGYQNTWASAISTKQNANNPKTYEVYLNITNPFTLQNPEAKSIYLNEFIKGGNSLSYDPYTDWTKDINNLDEIDWTEAEDLREWLVENHPEYDGLILDEGGDGGYGEAEYRWRGKSFVPFNANQIKNVDNRTPTDNPDIRYSLPTKEWQQYLDENYKASGKRTNLADIRLPVKNNNKFPVNQEAEMANILQKPQEKVKEKDRSWAIIKANLIDKGMVFEELSRKTGNRELQGKWDTTLTSTAKGQNAIGNARYELDPKTKTQKQISKSLTDIIDEVGENTADFYSYMYHQLNIDRMTLEERFNGDTGINYERKNLIMNKPVFGESVSAQMSRQTVAELEKKHPEFKEYAQDVYDYLDANTKELVDNGVISKETQQLFKDMYPHYVPISRIRNKGQAINIPLDTGRTGINSPIKKATGGSSDINPLFETIADRTLQTYRASARNSFGVELKNTLGKTNQILEKTDVDAIMENMTDEEQNKQLLQEGKNGENPTFTVFENGNKITYEITKDMYDALKPKNELLSKIDENKVSKIANKINNFRRGLLTEYNPVFSITNAIKDSQDILLNSQHSAKTYAKIPEATAQILSKGYWYNEYIQNGGSQNSYFKDGEFEIRKNNLPTKIKNTITIPLKAISNVNNVIEMTPRLAEYIVSREQGRSIETSMLDAARVTTNFKAGGDITKTLNRNGFTFLNASVQGMQQQIRNIQEANAKGLKGYAILACKYAISGAPVLLLNNLLWADDDEYEELQDYVKDNYYIIGKLSNGKFLRIPKGRAVATIQKIVSNVNDFVKNDTINSDKVGKVFWEDMKENIQFGIDNLAPNNPMENNILSPIFQAITNKTWYGEDLVPTRLQNKPKEEQYDETTDSFSRWLGEKTGLSPIKINYLIDQYSGGVGDVLLPMGTPQAENNVIEDKFTTDATMKSKYPGEFFTKVDELEINSNSSKATDEDIIKYKYISSISTDIGKLYQKKREIQNSSATDKEKKTQLKEVQKQINELAENSLDKVEKITKGKNYAQIDTKQYYKDAEGEWKSVPEKDMEKNKKSGLSLQAYSSYKHEISKVKQEKVQKGELTEEQNLKDSEQIQILLDSNYSNKEKSIIYEDYIKSSVKDGEYDVFKVIKASGININEYLKYEQQEFVSDKKDDGTLAGKTVSKSKQKKVIEYLNSMNIKGNQRLLLYAMQGYTTTSSQKAQLANYVKELKIDKDTKLKLYDKFSGFTVYKDGRVKW